MTSIPIIYYALFDFEYEKDTKENAPHQKYLMKSPELYQLGLQNKCYSMTQFAQWFAYAMYHSTLIYFTCLHFLGALGQ